MQTYIFSISSSSRITESEEALSIIERYKELMKKLEQFEEIIFTEWKTKIPAQIEEHLKKSLIARKPRCKMLILNFSPVLFSILKEVHYLKQMEKEGIPEVGLEFALKSETYRGYTLNLEKTIDWYNQVLGSSTAVELELIKKQVEEIDALVAIGIEELNWNSEGMCSPNRYQFVNQIPEYQLCRGKCCSC